MSTQVQSFQRDDSVSGGDQKANSAVVGQVGAPTTADKASDTRARPWENIVRDELDDYKGKAAKVDLFSAGDHHEFHTQSL